jgi:V8-like Glu-specific endopeptidase
MYRLLPGAIVAILLLVSMPCHAETVPSYLKSRIKGAKTSVPIISSEAGKYRGPSEGITKDLVSGAVTREPLKFSDTIDSPINKTEFMNWVRIDLPVKPSDTRVVMVLTNIGGQWSRCTGTVIHPQLILTAGHCVHSGKNGSFATQVSIVPGYDKGNAPIGTYRGVKIASFSGWIDAGDNAHDIGVVQLDRWLPSSVPGYSQYLSGSECKAELGSGFPSLFDRTTYDAVHDSDEVQFKFQNIYRGCTQGMFWHAFPTDHGSSGSASIYNGTITGVMSAKDRTDGRIGYDARMTQGKSCFIYMKLGSGAICY